jgi:hypothetical protein
MCRAWESAGDDNDDDAVAAIVVMSRTQQSKVMIPKVEEDID